MNKINEIEVALAIVRATLGSSLSNIEYSEIVNRHFNLDSTEEDINFLFEPNVKSDIEDIELIYNNLT